MLDVCFLEDQFNFYFQAEICKTELIWTGYCTQYSMVSNVLTLNYGWMDGLRERVFEKIGKAKTDTQ